MSEPKVIDAALTPSTTRTTVGPGDNTGLTVIEVVEKPGPAAAPEGDAGEAKPLTTRQIQLVFLACVYASLAASCRSESGHRLSVAAFLGSLDQTIIATAMPTIASEYNALPQQSCASVRGSMWFPLMPHRDFAGLSADFDRVPAHIRAWHRPVWLQTHALHCDWHLRHRLTLLRRGYKFCMVLLWTSDCW